MVGMNCLIACCLNSFVIKSINSQLIKIRLINIYVYSLIEATIKASRNTKFIPYL